MPVKYRPVAARKRPQQRTIDRAIRRLAATDFDPNDYLAADTESIRFANYCKVCNTRYAPGGVCGGCRCRVKEYRRNQPTPRTFAVLLPTEAES